MPMIASFDTIINPFLRARKCTRQTSILKMHSKISIDIEYLMICFDLYCFGWEGRKLPAS